MAILVTVTLLFVTCTKEESDVRLDSKLSSSQILNLKSDSATIVGFVVAAGGTIEEKGVVYSTSASPTIENTKVVYTGDSNQATFHVTLTGLNYATKYYAKAYLTNESGTYYGEEIVFTTLPVVPTLLTAPVTSITGNSAAGGGSITVNGGAAITARGIVWGTSHNPTVSDSKTSDGTDMGEFTSAMASLKGNTTYYVRAYAANSAGTGYGPEVSFKTLVDLPAVTTTAVSGITKFEAKSGGDVTYDGGAPVTARGLVWSTTENPTLSNNVIPGGDGLGSFVSSLTGLTLYTEYHVRAYATNSAGTAYGSDVKFTTLANTITWYVPGGYVEASYPGSALANWAPDKSPMVKSTMSAPNNVEGYVYMAGAENEWKIASQPNWDGPNYGAGAAAGTLSSTGENIKSPAGYYKINIDASKDPMTYTAVATVWGVIGDATPAGWGDETALTYNPTLQKWTGGIHMTAAEFKFRANHSWDYNYGSDAADGKLTAGGSNIPIATEADYAVTLDLSKPNEYTYSINAWGIIGDATGSWDTDKNMTWDATAKVFKLTTDLVVGEIKFRANDAWTVNLGGALDALTDGGDNIAIATAGNYTITLDPWLKKATLTKNL